MRRNFSSLYRASIDLCSVNLDLDRCTGFCGTSVRIRREFQDYTGWDEGPYVSTLPNRRHLHRPYRPLPFLLWFSQKEKKLREERTTMNEDRR